MKRSSRFSSKINNKRRTVSCQVWKYVNPNPIADIVRDPINYFNNNLTEAERVIFNDCLVWSEAFEDMYFTQSTIAERTGRSRGFVNRTIGLLTKIGVLAKNYRHKTSCQYKVSNWFRNEKVRSALNSLFMAFVLFPVPLRTNPSLEPINFELLKVIQSARWKGRVTQQEDIFKYNNQVRIPYKETSDYIAKLQREIMKIPRLTIHDAAHQHIYEIPEILKKIPALNLSKWGQIKLSCFPDKAIEYAYKQVEYAKHMDDKFRWFFKLCRDWCEDNNVRPNWERAQRLAQAYCMPDKAKMVLDARIGNLGAGKPKSYVPTVGELLGSERPAKAVSGKPLVSFSDSLIKQSEALSADEMKLAQLTEQQIQDKVNDFMKINEFGITAARGWLADVKRAKEKMAMQNSSLFDLSEMR